MFAPGIEAAACEAAIADSPPGRHKKKIRVRGLACEEMASFHDGWRYPGVFQGVPHLKVKHYKSLIYNTIVKLSTGGP